MTTRNIKDQIITLKTVTAEVSSSKDAAIAFLRKAGIISKPVRKAKVSGLAAFVSPSQGQWVTRTAGKKAAVKHTATRKTCSKKH